MLAQVAVLWYLTHYELLRGGIVSEQSREELHSVALIGDVLLSDVDGQFLQRCRREVRDG